MTDFVSYQKEFKEWKGDENSVRRKRFIEKAIRCIGRHVKRGFSATIPMSRYDQVNAQYCLSEEMEPPLVVAGLAVIRMASEWAKSEGIDPGPILYFMEDGDEDRGKLMTKARSMGLDVQPLKKSACKIFEACDMAAWKLRIGITNAQGEKGTIAEIIRSVSQLDPIMHNSGVLSRRKLEKNCVLWGITPRKQKRK
jgi:hypothetical protein